MRLPFACALTFGLTCAVACSEDKTAPLPNSGRPDATTPTDAGGSPDAGAMDASTSGQVAITVLDQGNPLPGIDVVFSDALGAFVDFDQTPPTGTLRKTIEPDTMVTILVRVPESATETQFLTFTYVGVQPGDELTIGDPSGNSNPTNVTTATVSFGAAPTGTRQVVVDNGCSSTTTSTDTSAVMLPVNTSCIDANGLMHVLVTAIDNDNQTLAYSVMRSIRPTGTPTTSMRVDMPAFGAMTDAIDVAISNPRPLAYVTQVQSRLLAGTIEFRGPERVAFLNAGGANVMVDVPRGFSSGLVAQVNVGYGMPNAEPEAFTLLSRRFATSVPATYAVDVSTDTLPPVFDLSVDKTGGARPSIAFRMGGDPAIADGMLAQLGWQDGNDVHEWTVIAPPNATSPIVWPELPERFGDFRPSAQTMYQREQLILFEADFVRDWDHFRQDYGPNVFDAAPPQGDVTFALSIGGEIN